MNETLQSMMDRVLFWPQEAQDEAVEALADIERRHAPVEPLSAQERETKLAALRETLNRSIERGGSHTNEEVGAFLDRLHAEAENQGR